MWQQISFINSKVQYKKRQSLLLISKNATREEIFTSNTVNQAIKRKSSNTRIL